MPIGWQLPYIKTTIANAHRISPISTVICKVTQTHISAKFFRLCNDALSNLTLVESRRTALSYLAIGACQERILKNVTKTWHLSIWMINVSKMRVLSILAPITELGCRNNR